MEELKIKSPIKFENIDKLRSEAYDRIMNDKIIRKFIKDNDIPLTFVNDNLGLFVRMEEENRPCLNCRSYKNCKKASKGYLTLIDAYETIYYEPCKYYREFLEIKNKYLYSDFNEDLLFVNYKLNDIIDPESRRLFAKIVPTIINKDCLYISSKDNLDVVLDLEIGTINHAINNDNKKIAVLTSTTLRNEVEYNYKKNSDYFYKYKEEIFNADILVVNSLGNEIKGDYYTYSFLMDLISFRKSHKLATIFTSYFKINELNEVYSGYNAQNRTKILINKFKECFEEYEFNTIYKKEI